MISSTGLALNGKFLKGQSTAVSMVGEEYLRAIPDVISGHQIFNRPDGIKLFLRRGTKITALIDNLDFTVGGFLIRHLWEQFDLPRLANKRLIINFCNLGPVATKNAITIIHDAHVFETPSSYSKAFVAYYKYIYSQIGKKHKKIVTISAYSKMALIRHGVAEEKDIAVIPNGLDHVLRDKSDPDILSRLKIEPENYVLGLSNTYKHKNIKVVLDAFKSQKLGDLKLVLYGQDNATEFIAKQLIPSENVIFTGRVTNNERRALFENALCFAFPSKVEGFGLPPGEAMLLGCPVIATRSTAVPEVCGDAALYADPDDPETWEEHILLIKTDPEIRAAMKASGLQQTSKFTWAASTEALLNVATNALEEGL